MTNITKAAQDALEVTLYECVACEHLYQHKVSQCDCLENHDNEYREWIAKPKATNSAALQDKAMGVRIPAAGPSTYEQRFAEAVRLLTHASPPADMVSAWLDHTSEDLQRWIGLQKGTPEWAQCLAITDAAHAMAISPIEGEQHTFEPLAAQPAPAVPDRDVLTVNLLRHTSLTKTQARALIAHWLDGVAPDAALFKKADPVVPDGFALVPVVATFDMRAAGNIELDRLKNTPGMLIADRAFYVWAAMIAASQQKGGQHG